MPALDGLRGCAVLAVMLLHYGLMYSSPLAGSTLGRFYAKATGFGWMGVDLFFVLSGFLITGILLDAKGSPHYFRNFFARRTLRIVPLYYGVLVTIFIVLPIARLTWPGLDAARPHQGWLWFYVTNFAVYRHGWAFVNPTPLFLDHFWSLAVEEHFYLLWPLVIYYCTRRNVTPIALAVVGVALLCRSWLTLHGHPKHLELLTPCRADGLAMGSLLAIAAKSYSARQVLAVARPLGIVAVIFVITERLLGSQAVREKIVEIAEYTWLAIIFAWLVAESALLRPQAFLMTILARSPLAMLGRYSYGIYVFHQMFNQVTFDWMNPHLPRLGALATTLLYSCIAGSSSVAIAFASYHLYEKQFLKLKRHFPATAASGAHQK